MVRQQQWMAGVLLAGEVIERVVRLAIVWLWHRCEEFLKLKGELRMLIRCCWLKYNLLIYINGQIKRCQL